MQRIVRRIGSGLAFFVVVAMVAVACGGSGIVASPSPTTSGATGTPAAKLEGPLVIYGSLPVAAMNSLGAKFKEKTGVDVQYLNAASGDVTQKFLSEATANQNVVDLITISALPPFVDFADKGLLLAYQSPSFQSYDPKYKDEQGRWAVVAVNAETIVYNKNVIKDADAPKTWKDLLNPKFSKLITIPDERSGGTAYLWYYAMRQQYGPEFHQQLGQLRPKLQVATASMGQSVLTGEVGIAAGILHYTTRNLLLDQPSAPLVQIYPDPVPLTVSVAAIAAKAPHVAAAKAFMDFWASQEGQQLAAAGVGSYSPRSDVVPSGVPALSSLHGFFVGAADTKAYLGATDANTAEFTKFYLQ